MSAILSDIETIKKSVDRVLDSTPLEDMKTSFSVIAVRCNSDESTGRRKLVSGKIYYLLDGYSVERADELYMTLEREHLNNLYDDYMITGDEAHPHVQVSAIVGQNGAGKSSLIEFIMRLINNFSAMVFGERKRGNKSERLHFIDGVDGDLWYVDDEHLYRLHVKNSNVALFRCGDIKEGVPLRILDDVLFDEGNPDILGPENVLTKKGNSEISRLLEKFFYTIVSNHSLYAYNSNDFKKECDSVNKASLANDSGNGEWFTVEQRSWLNGLFHKNDGYQTPMVITPFRSEGNLNINRENSLARERLISLLVRHEGFRCINDHLKVQGLICGKDGSKRYGIFRIQEELGFKKLTEKGYALLRLFIAEQWGDAIGVDLNRFSSRPFYDSAIDYLVFKTLKIAYTYRQHNDGYRLVMVMGSSVPRTAVKRMVASQVQDLSHITRKIHQTLAYLIYDVYSFDVCDGGIFTKINFEDITYRWNAVLRECFDSQCSAIGVAVVLQALIPPPFLQSRLELRDMSDKSIDFETLSSGEKQQIYAVSSLLYHLDNLNSVKDDKSSPSRIPYRNVFLILEEVELYFHPELQQQFVKQLLDGIRCINLPNINAIHIAIVTHSPYVLSDIPKMNVLAMTKEGLPSGGKLKTFCANIHEMLKDSFFLSHGSQGDFAQWEIGHLMACIDIHRKYRESGKESAELYSFVEEKQSADPELYRFVSRYIHYESNRQQLKFSYEAFGLDFSEEKLRQRISIIDEPLVRQVLFRELDKAFAKTKKERILAQITELERELQQLKSE